MQMTLLITQQLIHKQQEDDHLKENPLTKELFEQEHLKTVHLSLQLSMIP